MSTTLCVPLVGVRQLCVALGTSAEVLPRFCCFGLERRVGKELEGQGGEYLSSPFQTMKTFL